MTPEDLNEAEISNGTAACAVSRAPACSAYLDVADCCISLDEARDVIRRREQYADELMVWMDERRNAPDFTTLGMIQERLRPLCSKPNAQPSGH
jgi:hypothetical protein